MSVSQEVLYDPEQGERELLRLVEVYKDLPIATVEVYGFFDVDGTPAVAESRVATQADFLGDKIRNPNLVYPRLGSEETESFVTTAERQVLDLMKDAVRIAHDDERLRAFEDLLRSAYLNIAMIQIASELHDKDLSEEKKAELVGLFNLANDEVYGRLDVDDFASLVHSETERAEKVLSQPDTDPQLQEIARSYKELLPVVERTVAGHQLEPAEYILAVVRQILEQEYADLITLLPDPEAERKLSVEELVALFTAAHTIRNTGWETKVVDGKTNVESKQSQRTTLIGSKRKALTPHEAIRLLLHENGMHVERRERGDKIGDPLLSGLGLAGYGDIEEGLGVALEEAWDGKTRESGTQYYLALGLARGLDGMPRDFRDTFELMWRREVLKQGSTKEVSDALIAKARNQAYIQCTRIFRGTPCSIPGLVYTKDQAYFNGSRKAWKVLSEVAKLPEEHRLAAFQRLLVAKYDPSNLLHISLVEKALARQND